MKTIFTLALFLTPSYCIEGMDETIFKAMLFAFVIVFIRMLIYIHTWLQDKRIKRIKEDIEWKMEVKQRHEQIRLRMSLRGQNYTLN